MAMYCLPAEGFDASIGSSDQPTFDAYGMHPQATGIYGLDAAGLPVLPLLGTPTAPMMLWPVPFHSDAAAAAAAQQQSPLYGAATPVAATAGMLAPYEAASPALHAEGAAAATPGAARRRRAGRRRGGGRQRGGGQGLEAASASADAAASADQADAEDVASVAADASPKREGFGCRGDGQSSSRSASPEDLGSPSELVQSAARCAAVSTRLKALKTSDKSELHRVIEWFLPVANELALEAHGCRLVQDAVLAAAGPTQCVLLGKFEPHIQDLYESPHGNHVLTRMIEVMPSAALGPIISWLEGRTPAGLSRATTVARHRFGCRVLERLIEHCSEVQLRAVMDEVASDSEALCRHPYGNFVVQHLLEHGSDVRRREVLKQMMPGIPMLAMHRTASHVVQKALDFCDEDSQGFIVASLLEAPSPNSLLEIAVSRYGSFVAEQLSTVTCTPGGSVVKHLFLEHREVLLQTRAGCRVAEKFGVPLPAGAMAAVAADEPRSEASPLPSPSPHGAAGGDA